jgi:hypothetical protein
MPKAAPDAGWSSQRGISAGKAARNGITLLEGLAGDRKGVEPMMIECWNAVCSAELARSFVHPREPGHAHAPLPRTRTRNTLSLTTSPREPIARGEL